MRRAHHVTQTDTPMRTRLTTLALILAALVALAAGCGTSRPKSAAQPPPGMASVATKAQGLTGELNIFVPCGISGPYGQIKKLFEARNPGLKVKQDLANIDVQTKLICDGKATPDVWLALGDREMQRAQKCGKVEGEPVTYAFNSVAFMVQKNNPCGIADVKDITKAGIKTIAIPTEENSSGYYAMKAFEKTGVAKQIEGRLWITPEPSKVKAQVSSGKAEVGIVYYPCARETRIMGGEPTELQGKAQLLGKIPADLSGPIPAQAAVVKGCSNAQAGKAFLDFLMTDEVQDIWENWAFDRAKQPASGKRITLYIYCGSGIRPVMDKVVEAFKAKQPGVRIDVGYAGSGCLLSQLTFARRGDIYMPGETFYMEQAKQKGYITSDKLAGYFDPVLLVQKGNPKGIRGLADLAKPEIKVGLGEPDACAVGVAAKQALDAAKLTAVVDKNVTVRANNVNELGNYVKLKSLDVAIVWNLTALQVAADCDSIKLPAGSYKPSAIPVGLLKFTEHQPEAQAFIDLLTGPEGQKIVREGGMTPAT